MSEHTDRSTARLTEAGWVPLDMEGRPEGPATDLLAAVTASSVTQQTYPAAGDVVLVRHEQEAVAEAQNALAEALSMVVDRHALTGLADEVLVVLAGRIHEDAGDVLTGPEAYRHAQARVKRFAAVLAAAADLEHD